ncbi:MAG: LuxR C-terminal-related transcriptional regulator [Planctomycetota bacterium]
MNAPHSWMPDWISRVGFALWVCDPEGRIAFFNERAERLFHLPAGEAVGRPCHGVIRAVSESGVSVCRPDCEVRLLARCGREIESMAVRVPVRGRLATWVQVSCIPLQGPECAPWLVHLAHGEDRLGRVHGYLARIAARTPARKAGSTPARLTQREREILALLAGDEDTHAIARRLHVSYVTVRNHVQNVLRKLDAHSVPEAVARYLLHPSPSVELAEHDRGRHLDHQREEQETDREDPRGDPQLRP